MDCADTVLAGRAFQSRIADGKKEPWLASIRPGVTSTCRHDCCFQSPLGARKISVSEHVFSRVVCRDVAR